MHAESSASTSWQGTLARGSGRTTLASGVAGPLDVSWAKRTERGPQTTSPEELIAAAHASCYAMAFSHELAEAGGEPEQLDVSATVTFEIVDGAPTISRVALTVRGSASGIDADRFAELAGKAKDGCPVSRALAGNVDITLDAAAA
jgi:osmotically inducible protein OsmC